LGNPWGIIGVSLGKNRWQVGGGPVAGSRGSGAGKRRVGLKPAGEGLKKLSFFNFLLKTLAHVKKND